MPRLLAIGDIHGHARALDHLIRYVQPRADDTIVSMGDYINRGPDSCGVIERLLSLKQQVNLVPLKGNHEAMMIDAEKSAEGMDFWLSCGGDQTLRSYRPNGWQSIPPEHWEFIRVCKTYHETDRFIFAHANADASLYMSDQAEHTLLWEHLEYAPRHFSGKTLIVGHTPQAGGLPVHFGSAVCIDSDVHRSGWLTCYEPQTGRYWQANDGGKTRSGFLDMEDL